MFLSYLRLVLFAIGLLVGVQVPGFINDYAKRVEAHLIEAQTGLRGFDSDVCRFQISDLTDHDDVRILAQKGLQRDRESEARLFIHVHLVDAGKVDFRRVFSRGDVDARSVEHVQTRVERDRLTGTRRPCHQYHPVRTLNGRQQSGFFLRLIAQCVDTKLRAAGIQNTNNDFFAEERGQRADTEINHAIRANFQLHASVLGDALFRDV